MLIGGRNGDTVCGPDQSLFYLDTSFFKFPPENSFIESSPSNVRRWETIRNAPKHNTGFDVDIPSRSASCFAKSPFHPTSNPPCTEEQTPLGLLASDFEHSFPSVSNHQEYCPITDSDLLEFLKADCPSVVDHYQLLSRVEPHLQALENHDWTTGTLNELMCLSMIDKGGTASVFQMYDSNKREVWCLICFNLFFDLCKKDR